MPHDGQGQGLPPPPAGALDPVRVQGIINSLADQRNAALDQIVNLRAELQVLTGRLEVSQKTLSDSIQRQAALIEQVNKLQEQLAARPEPVEG